ncbi:MAG: ABC transporter ATP-binding protein [Proteobacteria bacterium]|nr:ABC transporter ATP-binding protein [Pseudomonadota bacterium]
MKTIAHLNHIRKTYGTGEAVLSVLNDFSMEIAEGDFVAIQGRSGSGKTTLLNIIGLLDSDFSGDYELFSYRENGMVVPRNLRDSALSLLRNEMIGFVFQHFNLLEHMTCFENVCLPASFCGHDVDLKQIEAKAYDLMKRLDVADKRDALPSQLSGGQKQRVAIARALLLSPKLILCDEPTGALDVETSRSIMACFRELCRRENMAFVIVTHDQGVADACDRIIKMEAGRIAQQ